MSDQDRASKTVAHIPASQPMDRQAGPREAGGAPQHEAIDALSSPLGDASCVAAHAQEIHRTQGTPGATQAALLRLQRRYGNHHVGQVLNCSRDGDAEAQGPDAVERSIQQARGGGQGLDRPTQVRMESAFGADFSGVRIHTDSRAESPSIR